MPSIRRGLFALCAAVATLYPGLAQAWWNDDWQFRKELTFDLSAAGANISGTPTNVPVLVRLSLANFEFFNDTKPDGGDLRFIAGDDKTALKYHIERYDPQSQMAFIWVQMPRLAGGAAGDKIYLYYGNKDAAAASDPGATYDANQALVYHFGPAAGTPQDSTAYKTDPSAFQAGVTPAALIGSGAQFTGNTVITIPAAGALLHDPAKGYTISAWLRIGAAPQGRAYVAALEDGNGAIVLGLDGARVFAETDSGGQTVTVLQTGDGITPEEWHHVALTLGAGRLALWVDGLAAGDQPAQVAALGGSLTVGGSSRGADYLTGDLDELQVSNTARPAEWLEAAARSQGMVAPLLVYGGDSQKESGGGEGYFATTLRSVTFDGWVIIGILTIMFFWSVWIMIFKGIYLGRVAKGNGHFLDEFHKLRDDPSAVERRFGAQAGNKGKKEESAFDKSEDEHEEFGASTLYRLYHHGMREVLTRIEGKSAGAARAQVLTPTAIESIRATMDASQTRMTQRLQNQMVLLTIAIAGGPFLGLLGTVVGVMITFAAIAVSGDVNVNAIAPGTAAALVATVFGLGVAIPCLFGYNWLNSRIKEIVADMRVFSDEFVARIAEQYS
jgi:biopolymer transport protein ExbB